MSETTTTIKPSTAEEFAARLLAANGTPADIAELVAKCLVAADLRGVDSHGINRLPSYIARIRGNVLDPAARPVLTQATPAVAQIDARNGFGFVAAAQGIDAAVEMAKILGIGMVSVTHSNHCGMLAWIAQRAADQDMMSLIFTNSSPALPVWGGREKLMGASPLACGAPGSEKGRAFVLDMAPTVAARGKVYKALRRGEKIPTDWALDGEGKPTDDPAKALEGVMLPMGGPKGSALSIMMDVFSGVLSGSAFAGGVTGPYDTSRPGDVGHFFVAIKPDLFIDLDEFRERMNILYNKVVGCQKAAGVDRIYFPGEIEQLREEERLREGIPYTSEELASLNKEAHAVDIPGL